MKENFEPRFAHDFSQVRIHDDHAAANSAETIQARAYTVGHHIVFGQGEYAPHTEHGRRLLAHELTHTLQQQANAATPRIVAPSNDPAEREAATIAARIGTGSAPVRVQTVASGATIYRQPAEPACALDPLIRDESLEVIEKARERLATLELGDLAEPTKDQNVALQGLSRNFSISAGNLKTHLETVRVGLQAISSVVESIDAGRIQCAAPNETSCDIAEAFVRRDENDLPVMIFCPSFFGKGRLLQQETFIHEAAHAADPKIKDWAYTSQRAYPKLPTEVALANADSYARFIIEMRETLAGETRELPLGATSHPDTFQECGEKKEQLSQALAEAELANYEALRVFSTPDLVKARGERLSWFNIVKRTGPGCEVNNALVQRYRTLYESTDKMFGKGFRVECDSSTDCEGGPVRYEEGILKVCLKWDPAVSRFPFFGWPHAILLGLHAHIEGVAVGEVPGAPREFRTGSAASIASWMIWEKRSEGQSGASNPFYCAPPIEPLRPEAVPAATRTRDTVRSGYVGWPVPELQEKLRVLVDRSLNITGVFDTATGQAVSKFQESQKLLDAGAEEGVADNATWARLFEQLPGHHGMPKGETFVVSGFRKDDEVTMLDFQQQLLPTTTNFKGLRVTEVDPGGGINTCCTVTPCHTKITGGTWTVGDDNLYGPDTVGLIAPQVRRYQMGPDRSPCFYLIPQVMVVDLPEGPFEYVRNLQFYLITKDKVTCSKHNAHDNKHGSTEFPKSEQEQSGRR